MSIQIQYTSIPNTSGSSDFTLTRNQIIELAYENIGVKAQSQQLTNEQYNRGSNMLNSMVKNWASNEIYLWNMDWITVKILPTSVISNGGNDYSAIRSHTSNLRNEPGVGDEWQTYWKLLGPGTSPAWAADNKYQYIGNYFLDTNIISIDSFRVKQGTGYTPVNFMSQESWFQLGDPNVTGKPTRYYFRKKFEPEIFLYPVPDNINDYTLELFVYKYPEDFDIGTDDADFLQEWIEPLIFGLSVKLAPQHGIFGQRLLDLKALANESFDNARSSDHEFGDAFIKPDLTNRGGI
jgi:hypothetical protein